MCAAAGAAFLLEHDEEGLLALRSRVGELGLEVARC